MPMAPQEVRTVFVYSYSSASRALKVDRSRATWA